MKRLAGNIRLPVMYLNMNGLQSVLMSAVNP